MEAVTRAIRWPVNGAVSSGAKLCGEVRQTAFGMSSNWALATMTSPRLGLAVDDLVLVGSVPRGLLPKDAPAFHEVRTGLR